MESSESRTSKHTKNKTNRTKSLESKKLSKQREIDCPSKETLHVLNLKKSKTCQEWIKTNLKKETKACQEWIKTMINWKTCQNRPHIKQRKVAYLNLKETVQRKRNRLSKQKKLTYTESEKDKHVKNA